jgi:hypothetical protein
MASLFLMDIEEDEIKQLESLFLMDEEDFGSSSGEEESPEVALMGNEIEGVDFQIFHQPFIESMKDPSASTNKAFDILTQCLT